MYSFYVKGNWCLRVCINFLLVWSRLQQQIAFENVLQSLYFQDLLQFRLANIASNYRKRVLVVELDSWALFLLFSRTMLHWGEKYSKNFHYKLLPTVKFKMHFIRISFVQSETHSVSSGSFDELNVQQSSITPISIWELSINFEARIPGKFCFNTYKSFRLLR